MKEFAEQEYKITKQGVDDGEKEKKTVVRNLAQEFGDTGKEEGAKKNRF